VSLAACLADGGAEAAEHGIATDQFAVLLQIAEIDDVLDQSWMFDCQR